MSKLINKILIFILIFLSILIIYFSTVGISTSKFNYIINEKLNLYNKSFNLNFSRIKFVLKPFNLLIKAEISDPELLFNEKKIYFEKIVSHISIRSLLSEKILLKNLNFKSKQNDLKNLIKLIRYDKDSIRAIILEKSINTGTAIFQINLDFDEFGKIKKNFKFNGKISNVILYLNKLNLNNNFNFKFNVENNELVFNNVSLEINDQIIKSNNIKVTKNKNEIYRVSGNIYN